MKPTISVDDLFSVLSVNFEDGKLFWKPRPRWAFNSSRSFSIFKSKFEGREALTAYTSNGYLIGEICGERHRAHRVVWAMRNGKWPDGDIDHIDGNRSNNAILNLRECTRSENLCNKRAQINNSTGFKGVRFDKRRGVYSASIGKNGLCSYLGTFQTAAEAARAYDEAALSIHGDFAKLNFALEARAASCN